MVNCEICNERPFFTVKSGFFGGVYNLWMVCKEQACHAKIIERRVNHREEVSREGTHRGNA
jgi:hypothetical protein